MNNAILRTAALEFQTIDKDDIIKSAGIFARIKNWYRAFQSPIYKERVNKLKEDSAKIKYLLNILGENIDSLESAIADSDVPLYERSLGVVKDYSLQLAQELGKLGEEANAVQDAVPEETKEIEENSPELEWVTSGYKNDAELIARLRKQLPEGFDVPIGKINQPFSSFNWFKQFAPDNIRVSPSVETKITTDVIGILSRYVPIEEATSIVKTNIKGLIDNFKNNLITNSMIYSYRDPRITEEIQKRPINQMFMVMGVYNVSLPGTDILVDFPTVGVTDMMASFRPSKSLNVNMIKNVRYNPLSGKISPTKEDIKQTSPIPEPKASRKQSLLKLAEGTEVAMKSTPVTPEELKKVLLSVDPTFSPQAADLFVKHIQFENGADLTSINNYNVGNITASSKWNGMFWRPPWYNPAPNAQKRYIDLHEKMLKGQAPKAFRAHNNIEEGVIDYLKMLKVSFPSVDQSLRNADAAAMAKDLVSSNYCPDCNAKTLAKHFGVPVSGTDESGGWAGLGNEKGTLAINKDNSMPQQDFSPDQQQGINQEYNALMRELTSMGPVEKMVRTAILKAKLPTTRVLISLNNEHMPVKVRFAHLLSSALRNEIDADVSIHTHGNVVELECDVVGSKNNVLQAVQGISDIVSNGFKVATKMNVETRLYDNLTSEHDLLTAEASDENYRKFALMVIHG